MSNRNHLSRLEARRKGNPDQRVAGARTGRPPHTSRLFHLSAEELWRDRGVRREVAIAASIEGLSCMGSVVSPSEPVDISLWLVAEGSTILADGVLSARWQGTCRRCLVEVGGLLTVPVHEMYRQDMVDDLVYPITGGIVALEPLIRDALLTSLPLAPLCTEGCKGLCPGCGADLNQDSCTCRRSTDPSR